MSAYGCLWVLVGACGCLWATLISVAFRLHKLEDKLKPRLCLSCGPNVEGSVGINHQADRLIQWYRIVVTISGVPEIAECTAYVTRVTLDGETQFSGDQQAIPFSPSESQDALSKVIRNREAACLDVVAVSGGQSFIATKGFQWPHFTPHPNGLFGAKGKFLITVLITGKDIVSQEALLEFEWNGSFSSTLNLVTPPSPDPDKSASQN